MNASKHMSETELFEATLDLYETIEQIQNDFKYIVRLWFGHYNFRFKTLTPEYLEDLNALCCNTQSGIQFFLQQADYLLGYDGKDSNGFTLLDYEDDLYKHEFELELMKVIQNSFILSSCNGHTLHDTIDTSHFEHYQRELLRTVVVNPWNMPEFPKVVVPERPSVILKVLSLSDSATRVSAGLDDVFYTQPLVRELLVDDDVQVGDHIIVKTSGWSGCGAELDRPEYDGIAEFDCPCSDMNDVLEAKYDFDLAHEEKSQETIWFEKHFIVKTLQEIGSSGYDALCKARLEVQFGIQAERREGASAYCWTPS